MTYTCLSLFSGIGGIDLAFSLAGFDIIGQVEIDTYCQQILEKHKDDYWQNAIRYDDVRTITGKQIGYVDGIVGGFPCQDISIAGNGLGLQGARSGLWYEFARLVSEIRPRFVLLENVPAITHRGGLEVVANLTALGYDCRWGIISASDADAPHKRERWFCVGYANSAYSQQPRGARQISIKTQRHGESAIQRQLYINGRFRRTRQIHGKSETMGNTESNGDKRDNRNVGKTTRQATIKNVWGIVKRSNQLHANNISHADGEGLQGRERQESQHTSVAQHSRRGQQAISQSRMGRDADGLSKGLDIVGHTFPNPPNMAQKTSEPNRLVYIPKGRQYRIEREIRKDRIKALGNAVVPQVVYPIAVAIMQKLLNEDGVQLSLLNLDHKE